MSNPRAYVKTLPIAGIRRDGGTQIRVALDEETVAEYTRAIKAGATLPPVTVYSDLEHYWLSDGFHRIEAATRAGLTSIEAETRSGSQRDAILAACGANAAHGLRRSNADKRRAVETLLADPEWQKWTDRAIAKVANVDKGTVAARRAELVISPVEGQLFKGLDGRERARPAKDSTSGQPTSVSPPAENPTAEGKEGTGVPVAPDSAGIAPAAPVPPDPRDRLINVERMLRDAQAEIAPLVAKGAALAVLVALNDALAVVRHALEPAGDFEVAPGAEPDAPIPYVVAPAARVLCKGCGGEKCGDVCLYSPAALGAKRSGWPEPPRSASRSPHVRIVLETAAGDVPFEDISQAGPADAV